MKTEATPWTLDQAVTELGIKAGVSNEVYHSGPGLSCSGLKQFAKTPAHYLAYRLRESEETASQRLGTLAHMAVLEPERFERDIAVNDENRNSNAFKAFRAEAEASGKYVCKTSEYEAAAAMRDGVYRCQAARKLLSGGKAEQTIRWRDPETGVLLKCRPDYLRPDGVVVDIKTFADLSKDSLERQIERMRYHWQSAFYLDGVNTAMGTNSTMFAHLFVDTEAFIARVVVLEDEVLEKAQREIVPLVDSYAECMRSNLWTGYPDEILTVSLPDYVWKEGL